MKTFVKDFIQVRVPEHPPDQRRIGLEIYVRDDGSVEYFGYKMIFNAFPLLYNRQYSLGPSYPKIIIIYPLETFGTYATKETTSLLNLTQRLADLGLIDK